LDHSKVSFTYVRHPGSLPTRGMEALAMGCAVLVQKEACYLYAAEKEGFSPMIFSRDLAPPSSYFKSWPEIEKNARRGAEIIRREFCLPRVASSTSVS